MNRHKRSPSRWREPIVLGYLLSLFVLAGCGPKESSAEASKRALQDRIASTRKFAGDPVRLDVEMEGILADPRLKTEGNELYAELMAEHRTVHEAADRERKASSEVLPWLGRYERCLDTSDSLRASVDALYDEVVVLEAHHRSSRLGPILNSAKDGLEAFLVTAPSSGKGHDLLRARQDPEFRQVLERRTERAIESLRKEGERLRDQGQAQRACTLLRCAASHFDEGSPPSVKIARFIDEMSR